MTNRFHMTREDNIFWAKRNVVDSIWKEANIEGIGVTFPETKEIFEGRVVAGLSVDETIAINNLKHAWQFVFDNIDAPVDLAFVRQVNFIVGQGIIADPGDLRVFDVSIGGTNWKPELPDRDRAAKVVREIYDCAESGERKALEMFASLCRAQLFSDGNKRTAQIVCNKIMIESGAGIMAIPVEEKREFEDRLIAFYESGDSEDMVEFLSSKAVSGYDSPSLQAAKQDEFRKQVIAAFSSREEKGASPEDSLENARKAALAQSRRTGRTGQTRN